MPETMTEPLVEAPICPCGKPMGFQGDEKTWRCLACNPIPMDAPKCKTQACKRPLTWIEKTGCWRCLICNPITEPKKTEERKKKYIGVAMTEEMVIEIIKEQIGSAKKDEDEIREIIRDELADWHVQKPPVTATEIAEATGVGGENVHISVQVPKPETWLQKAKRLGVRTHNEGTGGMRKKVDIMADMERKESETVSEELRTEE